MEDGRVDQKAPNSEDQVVDGQVVERPTLAVEVGPEEVGRVSEIVGSGIVCEVGSDNIDLALVEVQDASEIRWVQREASQSESQVVDSQTEIVGG
jgi:hypothetical protein